jgi:hypothetical protein
VAEDVHQQALARASVDLSPEQVAWARLALEQAAAAAGDPAGGGSTVVAGDAAAPQEEAAAASGAEAVAGPVAEQLVVVAAAPQPQAAAKPQRPPKGALLEAFAALVQELYLKPASGPAVCAAPMLRTLRAFPIAGACLPASACTAWLSRFKCSCMPIQTTQFTLHPLFFAFLQPPNTSLASQHPPHLPYTSSHTHLSTCSRLLRWWTARLPGGAEGADGPAARRSGELACCAGRLS